jgi:hypothetical protein
MRDVLDPKRFCRYLKLTLSSISVLTLWQDKKDNSAAKIPEFSQVGTIIEGPTEYFSGRLSNKKRKQTFVEEVLAREKSDGRFKLKYEAMQVAKTSGKKAHFKKMKELRRGRLKNR